MFKLRSVHHKIKNWFCGTLLDVVCIIANCILQEKNKTNETVSEHFADTFLQNVIWVELFSQYVFVIHGETRLPKILISEVESILKVAAFMMW